MTASANTLPLQLAQNLDQSASDALRDELIGKKGSDLTINASNVKRVGAQSLQVLLSAIKTWDADNKTIRIVHPSEEFVESIALVGISEADLRIEGSVE